ncbi:hypothetical protein QBC46DRAFT_353322 [Diplogelasinospora grovesii]|uniref:Uncharacterized protein n=1 Tax=Diplogelasinospora grovesii TaxID=303347 RepID=A0AAN6NC11_9PEZI|nr:hypothetical protein QBC46DRAFT_353322 [Diplogelasinospora grovesii]
MERDALHRRAIADPSSLSQAEINAVLNWLSPEDDERICREKGGGRTRAELVAYALSRPEELTKVECHLIMRNLSLAEEYRRESENNNPAAPPPPPPPDLFELYARMEAALDVLFASYGTASLTQQQLGEDAYWAVWAAAISDDEKRAVQVARVRMAALRAEARFERERHYAGEVLRIKRELGTRWIKDMLQEGFDGDGGGDCWGFVCFRTGGYHHHGNGDEEEGDDDAAACCWERFQKYYWQTGETVVLEWGSGDRLWPLFRTVFVSDAALDGAPTDALRTRFRAMVEAGEVPLGIRRDGFIVADDAAIRSDQTKRPYALREKGRDSWLPAPTVFVRAVHPDFGASPLSSVQEQEQQQAAEGGNEGQSTFDDPMAGFTGEVTLALPKVFDFLHFALFFPQHHMGGWEAVYRQTKVPTRFSAGFNSANSAPTYASSEVFDYIPEEHPYRDRRQQVI